MVDAATLQATAEHYQRLLDTAPDAMVVVGRDGRITFVNIQTERLFGYERSELLGKPLELLIPERFRSAHGGHLARYFQNPGTRAMGSGLQLFGRRRGGSEMAIEVSLSPVLTATETLVSAAIRDVTDRHAVEARAKVAAERLGSAVESIQDAFALFDRADELVLCNSVYRRLLGDAFPGPILGASYEHVLRAWMNEIHFANDVERAAFLAERLRRRHEDTTTFDLRMIDGRSLRVTDRRTADGGLVKTIWDLTNDVRLAEELKEARILAEAASNAKSEFLSSMSHELRTPMNAILGFTQLLQRDKREPLSERHRTWVDQILKGGEHLLRLIDDILDLARIEAGGISISTHPVEVEPVLHELRTTLAPAAERNGITVDLAALPDDLPRIAADRTRFAQILMNLGSNAIKYNRPGGSVRLSVSETTAGCVRITVTDTGIGIPLDKQSKLFQPFQRAGQEVGLIEGTGIGLVITRRLAELMGGTVGFASTEGIGSEFWVDIPVAREEEPPRTIVPATSSTFRLPEGSQRRILYVEDNPANVLFMLDLIEDFPGVTLLTAGSAEQGIELARTCAVDVIILDINLPGMSGVDALPIFLSDLRGTGTKARAPVIALTAAASERDKQRGLEAGFFRYLTKPVNVGELVDALQTIFGASP